MPMGGETMRGLAVQAGRRRWAEAALVALQALSPADLGASLDAEASAEALAAQLETVAGGKAAWASYAPPPPADLGALDPQVADMGCQLLASFRSPNGGEAYALCAQLEKTLKLREEQLRASALLAPDAPDERIVAEVNAIIKRDEQQRLDRKTKETQYAVWQALEALPPAKRDALCQKHPALKTAYEAVTALKEQQALLLKELEELMRNQKQA